MTEEWRNINFIKGKYQVSNLGNVRNINFNNTNKTVLMKLSLDKYGYNYIAFPCKKYKVHQLVARVFISNPENKPTVNHKDEVKTNNIVNNLEWATVAEQNKHSKGFPFSINFEGQNYNFNSLREGAKALGINRRKLKKLINL